MPDRECKACGDDMKARGLLVAAEALQPVRTARTVRVRHGKPVITDGPFTETKEMLAGFYLIDAADQDEAMRIAAAISGQRGKHRSAAGEGVGSKSLFAIRYSLFAIRFSLFARLRSLIRFAEPRLRFYSVFVLPNSELRRANASSLWLLMWRSPSVCRLQRHRIPGLPDPGYHELTLMVLVI